MSNKFLGWDEVANNLNALAANEGLTGWNLNEGQQRSVKALATRLPDNGVVVADEVGMGKTRISVALANAVNQAGGRVAILVPPALGYQWQDELRQGEVNSQPMVRSLWQYFEAWEGEEVQVQPWFQQDTIIISHRFCDWRLGEKSESWRWALLPELYANIRKSETGRYPNSYYKDENLSDEWVESAGLSIANNVFESTSFPIKQAVEAIKEAPWPESLTGSEYGRYGKYRELLEKSVGLGFGEFDLIIIDEAHKSRGETSSLSRLLENVLIGSQSSRRLAMSATPIELSAAQWQQTFARIHIQDPKANDAIKLYEEAVTNIRAQPHDDAVFKRYEQAAVNFKSCLSPYLLRRDKSEEKELQDFHEKTNLPMYEYRQQNPIEIEVDSLTGQWKRVVLAAESLSFVAKQNNDMTAKRLRLTLSNGHGIASLVDSQKKCEEDDAQLEEDEQDEPTNSYEQNKSVNDDVKRVQRVNYWKGIMASAFTSEKATGEQLLFNHPAILKTAQEIEKTTAKNEKVLVFGRFTQPMKALAYLLNARAMLRSINSGEPWPQMKLREEETEISEWNAVKAAHKQLGLDGSITRSTINKKLDNQYHSIEGDRTKYRASLMEKISLGFSELKAGKKESVVCQRSEALFKTLEKRLPSEDDANLMKPFSRAMLTYTGMNSDAITHIEYAKSFIELMNDLSDKDEGDENGDGKLDNAEAYTLWNTLKIRLADDYSHNEGSYARLMVGGTKSSTRRILQSAFNRKNSHPKVLIAQSMVGREGLNLHKACKTVILFHLEWNPGVVEQQIGRVDRVNSLWSQQMNAWNGKPDGEKSEEDCPRIQVRPVIFKGTYDEMNWQVLSDRWQNLQAQLHGMVISPDIARECDPETVARINGIAPRFSPGKD